jgi:hypothetical protein
MNCEENMNSACGCYSEPLCCLLVCLVRRLEEAKLRIWMEKITYSGARCKVVRPVTQEPYGTSSHSIRTTDKPHFISPRTCRVWKGRCKSSAVFTSDWASPALWKGTCIEGDISPPLSYMLHSGVRDRKLDTHCMGQIRLGLHSGRLVDCFLLRHGVYQLQCGRSTAARESERKFCIDTNKQTTNPMVWLRERTIPTERPPLVGEVIANFCG